MGELILTVTGTGNSYVLQPIGDEDTGQAEGGVTPDYMVFSARANPAPGPVLGYMEWRGNGMTRFDYIAMNYFSSGLGQADNLADALTLLDTWLISQGITPL